MVLLLIVALGCAALIRAADDDAQEPPYMDALRKFHRAATSRNRQDLLDHFYWQALDRLPNDPDELANDLFKRTQVSEAFTVKREVAKVGDYAHLELEVELGARKTLVRMCVAKLDGSWKVYPLIANFGREKPGHNLAYGDGSEPWLAFLANPPATHANNSPVIKLDPAIPADADPVKSLQTMLESTAQGDGVKAASFFTEKTWDYVTQFYFDIEEYEPLDDKHSSASIFGQFRQFYYSKMAREDFIQIVEKEGEHMAKQGGEPIKITKRRNLSPTSVLLKINSDLVFVGECAVLCWENNGWKYDLQQTMEIMQADHDHPVEAFLGECFYYQMEFSDECFIDEDADGIGEFAPLLDKTMTVSEMEINDLLDYGLSALSDEDGIIRAQQYLFRCYLPSTCNEREKRFCMVAWPEQAGEQPGPVFLLLNGNIYSADNADYQIGLGVDHPVALAAIFKGEFDGKVAPREDIWSKGSHIYDE